MSLDNAWSLDSYDMFREERNRKTITPLALDYRMNAFSDANYLQKTLTVFLMSVLVGLHRSPPQLIRAVGGKCPSILNQIAYVLTAMRHLSSKAETTASEDAPCDLYFTSGGKHAGHCIS